MLSSFHLFNITYVRYLMAIWCISFIILLIIDGGMCRFARKLMLLVCMAPYPYDNDHEGVKFLACALIAFITGLYLSSFVMIAWLIYILSFMCEYEFTYLDGKVRCEYSWYHLLACGSFYVEGMSRSNLLARHVQCVVLPYTTQL